MAEEIIEKRIFIGGLFDGVTEDDIKLRFKPYGHVKSVLIVKKENKNDGKNINFAYMSMSTDKVRLNKFIQLYNNTKWKGGRLKIQIAKENFIQRLNKEREDINEDQRIKSETVVEEIISVPEQYENDKTVAGQIVGEDMNWVVGKYGRILPVLQLKKHDTDISLDPSKRCHQVKKLYDIGKKNITGDMLTWDMATDNRPITAKITGKSILKDHVVPDKIRSRIEVIAEMRGTTVEEMNRLEVVNAQDWRNKNKFNDEANDDDFDFETIDVSRAESDNGGDDEQYNSADTEEMITQLKTSKDDDNTNKIIEKKKISTMEVDYIEKPKKLTKKKAKKLLLRKKKEALKLKNSNKSVDNQNIVKDQLFQTNISEQELSPLIHNIESSDDEVSLEKSGFCGTLNYLKSHPLTINKGKLKQNSPTLNTNQTKRNSITANSKTMSNTQNKRDRVYHSSESDCDTGRNTSNWRMCQSKNLSSAYDEFVNTDLSCYDNLSATENFTKINSSICDAESSRVDNDEFDVFDMIESGQVDLINNKVKASNGGKAKRNNLSNSNIIESSEVISIESDQGSIDDNKGSKVTNIVELDANTKPDRQKINGSQQDCFITLSDNEQNLSSVNNKTSYCEIIVGDENNEKSDELKSKIKKSKKNSKNEEITEQKYHKPVLNLITPPESDEAHFKMKFDKRKQSNQQRLKSLKDRKNDSLGQQARISQALKHIDKSFSTKKIIFSDNDDVIDNKDEKKERMQLFDDNCSSDDEMKDQEMFGHRKEFEGKAGAELMHLQSRFKSDSRFKLDERFIDSSSEDDFKDKNDEDNEKLQSLTILKDIIGEKEMLRMNKKEERKGKFRDISNLQYDPHAENSSKFELVGEDEETSKRIPRKLRRTMPLADDTGKQMAKETIAESVPGQFFNVESTLKESMKTGESSFSFGFNTENNLDYPIVQKFYENEYKTESTSKLANDLLSWKMKFSDESDDDDITNDNITSNFKGENKVMIIPDSFFFSNDDPRLEEGINWFCRTERKGTIRTNWKFKRNDLISDYQLRRKRALRNHKLHNISRKKSFM